MMLKVLSEAFFWEASQVDVWIFGCFRLTSLIPTDS